ncbi:MAG: LysR family transcriptional regulator, partial [Solirubrobacteraceae bacterium]|nr:LysR family transcriptional regulator [Solirubrobacteraceae bacterium]
MTMFKKSFLPPVADLLAFEAAARHHSISRAADELHLTQSAVSRQIRQLEQQLGIALFHRVRQRIVLTDI